MLKAPIAIASMCKAAMYRFARAESEFLIQLKAEVLGLLEDNQSAAGASLGRVPHGGLLHAPILENLLDALGLKGTFAPLEPLIKSSLGRGVPPPPRILVIFRGGGSPLFVTTPGQALAYIQTHTTITIECLATQPGPRE